MKLMNVCAVMVMGVAVMGKWQPSLFIFHQPEAPKELQEYSFKSLKKYL